MPQGSKIPPSINNQLAAEPQARGGVGLAQICAVLFGKKIPCTPTVHMPRLLHVLWLVSASRPLWYKNTWVSSDEWAISISAGRALKQLCAEARSLKHTNNTPVEDPYMKMWEARGLCLASACK